ncbi:MAG: Uncharacterized protein LiPW15_814 [Parcubacteria group bacterium LiPW_15]|nr:MAG: Uncharacterized protein LiPW15_814 [Parcubacteria group bacterium LiPW_15]
MSLNRGIVNTAFGLFLLVAFGLLFSLVNTASASTLTYSSATSLYLSTPDTYFVIQPGSTADALTVGSSTVVVTLATGDVFTINATSSDFSVSLTSGSGSTFTSSACSDAAAASVTITQTTASSTYTISEASICHSSSSPAPTLTCISPSSALAGGSAFTLTVNGTNFLPSSVIYWGGSPLTTTYASTTVLTASVPAANIASAGTSYVYISTPAPGGGISGDQSFVIYQSSDYNAYGLLGQLDDSGNPSYTDRSPNNAPNNLGFLDARYAAIDSVNHRLFVSDRYRVLVYNLNSSNQLVDSAADYVLGKSDFRKYYVAGVANNNLLGPTDLAYDSVGNRLFVVDQDNNRVLVFDLSTITNGMSASFVLGQANFTSSAAATTQIGMSSPEGLAYDSVGNRLFVGDKDNNRVLIFNTATITNGMSASFVLGQTGFTSSTATTTQGGVSAPTGLEYDSEYDRLFVGDKDNNRVLIFDVATGTVTNGKNASFVLGQINFTSSTQATTQASMKNPSGVSYDTANDRLFVYDAVNFRTLIFDVATGTVTNGKNASFVLGQANFTSGTYPASTWPSQNKFSNGNDGFGSSFGYIGTLMFNPAENKLFASDPDNQRFLIFSVATGTVSNGMNASGVLGQYDGNGNPDYIKNLPFGAPSANGLSAGADGRDSYTFPNRYGTALDLAGQRLFAADFDNNRVLVFNLDASGNPVDYEADYVLGQDNLYSRATTTRAQNRMRKPSDVAFDPVGNRLFVADYFNSRVLIFDTSSLASGMNASYVLGQVDFTSGVSATTQSGMIAPLALAFDSVNSRLFVGSNSSHRVTIYDVATSSISNGKNASFVLGQTTFTASNQATTQSGMSSPISLTYDSVNSRLFVGDSQYNRVTIFSVATGTVSNGMNASNVLGQTTFTASVSGRTQSRMNQLAGLAYDPTNSKLFVSDNSNQRVLVFDVAAGSVTDGQNASAVFGKADFTSSTGTTGQSGLYYTTGVSYNSTNRRLIVSDSGNNRIMFYKFFTPGSPSFPSSATMGNSYSYTLPSATDSQGTVVYSVTSGAVPPGLHFNGSTLSGTPTAAGVYSFTLEASDVGSWGSASTVAMSGTHTITVITNPGSAVMVGNAGTPSSGGGGGGSVTVTPTATTTATATPSTPPVSPATTTGIPGYSFSKNLYYGMEGSNDVVALQELLKKLGFYSGPITGNFYSLTQNAVIKFQKEHDIVPAVGYVGVLTRSVLNSAPSNGEAATPNGVSPAAKVAFLKNLYYGLENDQDVTALQELLTKLGFYTGPITGNFYSLTQKAVIAFQKAQNITPAAGYVGALTRGVLNGM